MAQPFGSLAPDDPSLTVPGLEGPVLGDDASARFAAGLAQTWPAHLINAIVGGAMAPGDAYSGKMPMAPPGSRREDFTDAPPPQAGGPDSTRLGTFLGVPPVAAQPNDEAVARAADLAGALAGWGTSVAQKGTLGMAGGRPPVAAPGAAPGAAAAVVAPPFYSVLEQAVTNAGLNKGVGQQWLGTLKNSPGVKADEIAALGLDKFLGEQRGAVTKQDVLDHIAANKVEVRDVVKGGGRVRTLGDAAIADDVRALRAHDIHPDTNPEDAGTIGFIHPDGDILSAGELQHYDLGHLAPHAERIEQYYHGGGAAADANRPKFGGDPRLVLPGGENYREHLLTLPEKPANTSGWRAEIDPDGYRSANGGMDYKIFDGSGQVIALRRAGSPEEAIARATKNLSDGASKSAYKSSHWDEPNVLAHMRTNDRLIPTTTPDPRYAEIGAKLDRGGIDAITPAERQLYNELDARGGMAADKTLHLEELQSDWHQQGRKQGYKGGKNPDDYTAEFISSHDVWQIKDKQGKDVGVVPGKDLDVNSHTAKDAIKLWNNAGGVPDAPFKTQWPELALKRAIRHAAENGYDRVSWTPGEAQAARYDLSKQVRQISWNPTTHELVADPVNASQSRIIKTVKPDQLADHIGKDAADKLLASETRTGPTYLPVPADVQSIVDKMLPGQEGRHPWTIGAPGVDANIGGRISDVEGNSLLRWMRENPTPDDLHSSARYSGLKVLQGDDLKVGGEGMKGFYDKMLPSIANKIIKAHGSKVERVNLPPPAGMPNSPFHVVDETGQSIINFRTPEDAQKYLDIATNPRKSQWTIQGKPQTGPEVHSFKITPELRKAALEKGFPLFSAGAIATGLGAGGEGDSGE